MDIACDVDDVVLDFCEQVVTTVNNEYGTTLTIYDITDWNLNKLLDPILGEDWWGWWEERDWLWANAPAIKGSIGGLRKLREMGHNVMLVTAKPDWARAGLWQWLGKWRPEVDGVIVGPARPPMNKAVWSDADLLIDDKPENCIEWVESRSDRMALLYNRPHNQTTGAASHPRIQRVTGWDNVLEVVKNLAEATTIH